MTQSSPVPPPSPEPTHTATTSPGPSAPTGQAASPQFGTPPPPTPNPSPAAPVAAAAPANSHLNTPNFAWPLAGVGMFFAGVFATLWWTGQKSPFDSALAGPEATAAQQHARTAASANRQLQQTALDNSTLVAAEETTIARQKWKELKRLVERGKKNVNDLREASGRWVSRRMVLLTSDEGKKLASDPQAVNRFAALSEKPVRDPSDVAAWNDELDEIDELVAHGLESSTLTIEPKASLLERVQKIHAESAKALRNQQADDAALAALLAKAPAKPQPDTPTLAEMLAEAERVRSEEWSKQRAQQLQQVRDGETTAKLNAELLDEKQRLRIQREREAEERRLQLVEEQSKTDNAAADADAVAKVAATVKAKREKERRFDAEFPEMKPLLSPLITPGKMALTKQGWRPAAEKQPISLRALNDLGLLAAGPKHIAHAQMQAAIGTQSKNDRPMGSFPVQYRLDDDTTARIRDFLNEYGDILIERKLLLP